MVFLPWVTYVNKVFMLHHQPVLAGISQEFQLQPPAIVLAVLNAVTVIPCGPPISVRPANVEWSKDFRQLIGDRFIVDGSNLTILDTQLSDSGIYYCTAFNPLTTQSVLAEEPMCPSKVCSQCVRSLIKC